MTTQPKSPDDILENTTTHESAAISRDDALAKIFGTKAAQVPLKFNGVDIILSEPDVGTALEANTASDRKLMTANMMIRYVRLPDGTPLFGEEHADSLMALPFNKDFQDLTNAINKLLGAEVTPEVKAAFQEESN